MTKMPRVIYRWIASQMALSDSVHVANTDSTVAYRHVRLHEDRLYKDGLW